MIERFINALRDRRERICALDDDARKKHCDVTLRELAELPDDARLVGAHLLSVRTLDNVVQLRGLRPYYEKLEPHSRGWGWNRYNARDKWPGFVRTYNFHAIGLVVRDFRLMLRDPDVQRSFVEFEYQATEDQLLAYVQRVYG